MWLRPIIFLYASALWAAIFAADDGLTQVVQWDSYSLMINGQRTFISSAEFHYQRLPVPGLWLDIFQKLKSNGFNTLSIYFFWSYHSPSPGIFDFETPGKDVQYLLDVAKEVGLWVIARPGPYCNAETSAGSLALWGSDGTFSSKTYRTTDQRWHDSWLPWVQEIGAIIARNQITNGGPIILNQVENEFQEINSVPTDEAVMYMKQVEEAFVNAGVVVPSTHNEVNQNLVSWSSDVRNVGAAVNIHGLDIYASGMSCINPNAGFYYLRNLYQWFQNGSWTQPNFVPEFEGGNVAGWGESWYDDCVNYHSPEFPDVAHKNNLGQRVTMQNIYMGYGGTNWGYCRQHSNATSKPDANDFEAAAPQVYTSYDYSAAIRETREQTDKLFHMKLINLFSTNSPDLLKTQMIGNGTGYRVSTPDIWTWYLRNPDTGAAFLVTQQYWTPNRATTKFSAKLDTSAGSVTVGNITLIGRQSIILTSDYHFADRTLLYSSADIATAGTFLGQDIIAFYLRQGQVGEFAFPGSDTAGCGISGASNVQSYYNPTLDSQVFTYQQENGTTFVQCDSGLLILLMERQSAWSLWQIELDNDASQQILVVGPHLVRSASLVNGNLEMYGDNANTSTVQILIDKRRVGSVSWNGKGVQYAENTQGFLELTLDGAEDRVFAIPKLENWVSANSLPEANLDYDDSQWQVCNKTTTLSPIAPGSLPVLFGSDYGFYAGPKIYRGYFDGNTSTSVTISAMGGYAFGWNAWLNGILIGGDNGTANLGSSSIVLSLPPSMMRDMGNVLCVLVDYHGHDMGWVNQGVGTPRGLTAAILHPNGTWESTGFKLWKIAGNAGGPNYIDPVRGPMNEGGLISERLGWALPDFDTDGSGFTNGNTPFDGLSSAGVRFYRTTFELSIDEDLDVPIGVELAVANGTVARALLWVNGYQFGKFVPHIGPQSRFSIPPGILNTRGVNILGLSLWAQTDLGAKFEKVEIFAYGKYQTGYHFDLNNTLLQPGWFDRSEYA